MIKKIALVSMLTVVFLTAHRPLPITAPSASACPSKNPNGSAQIDKTLCLDSQTVYFQTSSASDSKTDLLPAPTTMAGLKTDLDIVPDKLSEPNLMSANEYIGKTVYSPAYDKIGKVKDVIFSENGVKAVILGFGGILGIGEKRVAVAMDSIEPTRDGFSVKLVTNATREQLASAPKLDISPRIFLN